MNVRHKINKEINTRDSNQTFGEELSNSGLPEDIKNEYVEGLEPQEIKYIKN